MPTKKKILKKIEKQVVYQERDRAELEDSEEITRKKIDASIAPALDVTEELQKEWKHEELGRGLQEDKSVTNEGEGDIEKEEEAGEEPYPEIENAIKEEADEKNKEDDEEEEE